MASSAQALNYEIIDDLRGILGDGFEEIVAEQVQQADIYLREIGELLEQGKPQDTMRRAHALKSSSGQIGLQGIHALSKELEFTCNTDSAKGEVSLHAKELCRTIRDEFPGAVQALRAYIQQN